MRTYRQNAITGARIVLQECPYEHSRTGRGVLGFRSPDWKVFVSAPSLSQTLSQQKCYEWKWTGSKGGESTTTFIAILCPCGKKINQLAYLWF